MPSPNGQDPKAAREYVRAGMSMRMGRVSDWGPGVLDLAAAYLESTTRWGVAEPYVEQLTEELGGVIVDLCA